MKTISIPYKNQHFKEKKQQKKIILTKLIQTPQIRKIKRF